MLDDNQSREEWVRGWRREGRRERRNRHHNMGKGPSILAGLFLLAIGAVLISRNVGVDMPDWLFKWPMIPILIGLFIGFSNGFRDMGWLVVSGVGFFFLADDIWKDVEVSKFVIPGIIVVIGLALIARPLRRRDMVWKATTKTTEEDKYAQSAEGVYTADKGDQEEQIDAVSVFGNVKKNIFSKTFKGGEVVCVFGGAEINLTQADFDGKMTIEVVQVFGGTKLIIPPHWQVHSGDTVAVFGGIEDKRRPMSPGQEPERILILKGFTLFGGLEIKSY